MSCDVMSVFISHTREDHLFARRLAADLRLAGFSPQITADFMEPGEHLFGGQSEELMSGVSAQSRFYVPVLSPRSVEELTNRAELVRAVEAEVKEQEPRIFPVLAANCRIPELLDLRRPADFTTSYRSGLENLLDRLSFTERPADPLDTQAIAPAWEGMAELLQTELRNYLKRRRVHQSRRFQALVSEILRHLDYGVEQTYSSRESGIDLVAVAGQSAQNAPILLQCKFSHVEQRVGVELLKSLYLARVKPEIKAVVFVVTSCFPVSFGELEHRRFAFTRERWQLDYEALGVWLGWQTRSMRICEELANPLVQLRARFGELVDKRFSLGLTPAEIHEMEHIESILDQAEAREYQQTIESLRALHASLKIG